MDDAFGWNTQQQQPPAAASCCPSDADDDVILAAFLRGAGATFGNAGVRGGAAAITSDAAYDFTSSCPDDDLRRLLICRDSVSPLPFAGDDPSKSAFLETSAGSLRAPAPAIGAQDSSFAFFPKAGEAFSGYSTATGNISSGESNTYDADVASPPCIDIVPPPPAKRRLPETRTTSASGQQHEYEPGTEAMARVKETIYRAAAASSSSPPAAAADPPPRGPRRRRRNVRISSEPQTVAARLRREKVSERLRALRRLVPGGGSGKMDTASMLHQAACYLRFLKAQLARFHAMAADDGRYSSSPSSSMQRHVGRPPWNDNNPESLGGGNIGNGGAVLAFRRDDGVAGYVMKSNNRNVQSSL